jgi:hypothetical protein
MGVNQMVSLKSVEEQLKKIHFSHATWNHAEVTELPNILLPDEEIFECVNGTYEGGFALLCATNIRMLLIDKKPLKFLSVEDLRFDMITEIDYSHRIFGARISVSAGSKNLKFMSFNQPRLRKLIGHVQHCMAEVKKEQSNNAESQQQHLEQINQQLQAYLLAQQQQQDELRRQLQEANSSAANGSSSSPAVTQPLSQPEPIKPAPQLADYLFAQRLLNEHQAEQTQQSQSNSTTTEQATASVAEPTSQPLSQQISSQPLSDMMKKEDRSQLADIYSAGMQEIFGNKDSVAGSQTGTEKSSLPTVNNPLELNPLKIAYSKLPMALRDRAFVRKAGTPRHASVPTPAVTSAVVTQPAGAS